MKVLLLTRYGPLGASSRLRAFQYLPYLRSQGFLLTTMPFFGDYYQEDLYVGRSRRWGKIAQAYLVRFLQLARSVAFDLVWIEYELFPWLPALGERLLVRLRIPYVVDYDDAIYHRYELHRNWIVRRLLGGKIDLIMRNATVVIAGNSYLGERAQTAGARCVEYLPTVVDLERYPATPPAGGKITTLGWIGSPSTVGYLSLIQPVLSDFCRENQARLVVVGAREAPLDGVPVTFKPWSESTEVEEILRFDIGLMPLPDEPWERGKCGYKVIQYMACARPVIASPVGVNPQIVDEGINGFLAGTATEWRSALETLSRAPELRLRLGLEGRRKVETSYSTQINAPLLASILRRAAQTDGRTP
jgi:glycosyltransferase involved in cell wall biosynthesis